MYLNTHIMGWRLRRLRLRYGMSLVEVGSATGLHSSYISRLERDALQNAKPKPDTIDRILDALGVTPQERASVYHIELPPLTQEEIDTQVREVAALREDSAEPLELLDEHWNTRYYNRAARAALGYTHNEYKQAIGGHMLHNIIDPKHPFYARIPDEERRDTFALRAMIFKLYFGGQEFDTWYLKVVSRIHDVHWAAQLWEQPAPSTLPFVLEKQDFTLRNAVAGKLNLWFQMNHLVSNPRFLVSNWGYADSGTGIQLAVLRIRPEFFYPYDGSRTPLRNETYPAGNFMYRSTAGYRPLLGDV